MYDLNWYYSLNHPLLTPPAWVFAPVWTMLYITIFAALVIYLAKPYPKNKNWGVTVFICQLVLNLCWSPVFFLFRNISMALAILVTIIILVIFNISEFYKVSKTAGLLLIPYIIWLFFALYLNAALLVINN